MYIEGSDHWLNASNCFQLVSGSPISTDSLSRKRQKDLGLWDCSSQGGLQGAGWQGLKRQDCLPKMSNPRSTWEGKEEAQPQAEAPLPGVS